jgi:hypothetical protein
VIPDAREHGVFAQALEQSPGLRSAALVAHAMSPIDRDWLLSQLDLSQRAALQPLLDELLELQIPPDAELVGEALRSRHQKPPDSPPKVDDPVDRFGGLPARVVARVLADEPRRLTDRVLRMRPWPWRAEVLALQGATLDGVGGAVAQDEIRVGSAAVPTRLERLVLTALLARAAEIVADESARHCGVVNPAESPWSQGSRAGWVRRTSVQWLRRMRGAGR